MRLRQTFDRTSSSVIHRKLQHICLTSQEDSVPIVVVHRWQRTRRRSDDLRQNVGEYQQQLGNRAMLRNQHFHAAQLLTYAETLAK